MKRIVKQVIDGVHDEMYMAAVFNDSNWIWEQDYEGSTISVEGHEVRMANGFYMWDVQCLVDHDNDHESPLLEKAILAAIPDMAKIRREVEDNMIFS